MKIAIKCNECGKYIDINIGDGTNYLDIDTLAEREGVIMIRATNANICFAAHNQDCADKIGERLEAIYD